MLIGHLKRSLTMSYGNDIGKEMYINTNKRLKKLKIAEKNCSKDQRKALYKHILPVISIYQEMKSQQKEDIQLIQEFILEKTYIKVNCLKILINIPFFFTCFV